jgi:hypothetical protein
MIPWLSVLGAVLLAIFGYVLKLAHDLGCIQEKCQTLKCLPELRDKVANLDGRMEGYLRDLDRVFEKRLRDWPTHQERDLLMEKLADGRLARGEIYRLDELIIQTMREAHNRENELAWGFVRARLKWLRSKLGED